MARWSSGGDGFVAPLFKRDDAGWIFHTQGWTHPEGRGLLTPPWRTANFLVDDAQKAALEPVLRRMGRFYAGATMAAMLLAGAAFIALIAVFHLSELSVVEFALVFGLAFGGLSFALLALLVAWRQPAFQRELRTLLAGAPRTEKRIPLADRMRAKASAMSLGSLIGCGMVFALGFADNLYQFLRALPMQPTAGRDAWGLLALDIFGICLFGAFLATVAVLLVFRARARSQA